LEWFKKQTTYHFYSSSLIVVYEGNLERMINDTSLDSVNNNSNNYNRNTTADYEQVVKKNSVRIIMADFAHVFPANNTLDENYSFGLINLIHHLKKLVEPDYKFKDVRKYY